MVTVSHQFPYLDSCKPLKLAASSCTAAMSTLDGIYNLTLHAHRQNTTTGALQKHTQRDEASVSSVLSATTATTLTTAALVTTA